MLSIIEVEVNLPGAYKIRCIQNFKSFFNIILGNQKTEL